MSSQPFSAQKRFSAAAALHIAALALICLSSPAFAPAQVTGGILSGTITDPSGSAIPTATVVIKNLDTTVQRTVTTNAEGFYTAPNLLAGEYEVTVSAKGFTTETRRGIVITVGSQPVFDLALKVGTLAHTVEVTVETPAVQLATSEISATVNGTTVRELPLNGRSWTDLAALQPGVDTIQTQPSFAVGADRGNRGFGQQLTISGARPQQNNYRLDGVSLNDYANGAPGSVMGGNLGVDAIEEFSVLTSNYSAEYGKTSGGVVNAITRSGNNSLHGSAYEFLRNSALDARNFFEDPNAKKASFKRNQFGGALGGPIIKSRTFFFGDYEGNRQAKGIANLLFVPSPLARAGQLQSGAVPVDSGAQKYLALYPVPAACGNDICNLVFSGNQVVNENFVTGRVDHKFSTQDSMFGTYMFDRTPYRSPDSMGNVLLGSLSSRQIVAIEETHSFATAMVNALRFGFNHERVNNNESVSALNPAAKDPSLGAFTGRDAAFLKVAGLSDMSGGVGGLPTYLYHWNSFQGYDDAFWVLGTHTLKLGVALERMLLQATALTDPNGIWFFGGLDKFLQAQPTKFQGGIASSLTPRDFRQSIFGTYIQDDWRWAPNFTVNLGIRYEIASVPTELHGKLVNLRNITDRLPVCGVMVTGSCTSAGRLFSNPTLGNFEPRIGFAWDPFHNNRMAVRGGAGLYDVLPLPYEFILLETQAVPFFQYTNLKVAASNPQPLTFYQVPAADIVGNKLRSTYIDSTPRRNYVAQFNLNIQYQLTRDLAAMAAYVGSRGVHQPFRVDEADLAIPAMTSAGYVWGFNPDGSPLDPINPNFGSIRGMFYQGRSYYNALELQLARRMSHGLQVQGTYTWGKSIDTSSATLAGDAFGNSISSLHWFDMRLNRGLSDFNVGRTLVVSGTWELPSVKSWSGPARWTTEGWQLGLIFTASDGVPFPVTWGTGDDPANTNSGDDFAFPNWLPGPGCKAATNPGHPDNYINTNCFSLPAAPSLQFWNTYCNPNPPTFGPITNPSSPGNASDGTPLPALVCFNLRGNAGRNILIGPGINSLDFSVFKNSHIRKISENLNVQFRLEMFNILNHPNFAPPGPGDSNTDIFKSDSSSLSPVRGGTAGALLRTTIPERQIQFALKFIF